jgi:TetR/AcrR family transcriptional repressor of nem operon
MKISGESTAKKILDAGRQLIARRGYSNFSYADVSAAVTLHKASIHHHFPTKAALALAVTHHSRDIFIADMAALAMDGATPLAQLQAYLDHWEHGLIHDPEEFCVAAMLGAEAPFLDKDVAEAAGEYFASITSWLEELLTAGAACGEFHLRGPEQGEAATLVSLIYGALLVARATRNPAHFKQVTSAAVARLTSAPASRTQTAA